MELRKNMHSTKRFYAAACQIDMPNPTTRDEIAQKVDKMLEMTDYAVTGYDPFFDVRLVVFPEFAHAAPVYPTAEELHEKLAVTIPNEHTDRYAAKAKELGVYIQTGTFLECDEQWPGHVFNTTCLIGPEGIVLKYRKVHTWIPWEVHTSPHDLNDYDLPLFPVAETEIGTIGTAICYDWLFPEAIRQLALSGAEILIRVSAYMDPWGTAEPMDWWTSVNRVRALENTAYVVASNQASSITTAGFSHRHSPERATRSWWPRSTLKRCGMNENADAGITCWPTFGWSLTTIMTAQFIRSPTAPLP
jgi:predicted amidohydrolase